MELLLFKLLNTAANLIRNDVDFRYNLTDSIDVKLIDCCVKDPVENDSVQ